MTCPRHALRNDTRVLQPSQNRYTQLHGARSAYVTGGSGPQTIEHLHHLLENLRWSTFALFNGGQPAPNNAPRLASEPSRTLGGGHRHDPP